MPRLLAFIALIAILFTPYTAVHAEQQLTDQLSMSGVLEIDAYSLDQDNGPDELDLVVSTLEVGLDARINEKLGISTVFLYEDGFNGLEVDTAIMQLALSDDIEMTAGQMTLAFGRYETAALSDPLTLELGETADTAVQFATSRNALGASITLFNGDNEEIASQDDDQVRVLLAIDYEQGAISAGASWVSNLDSDVLADLAATTMASDVPAVGLYLVWRNGPLTLSAEHIAALDDYAVGDFGGDVGVTSQPTATALELAYSIDDSATLAVAFQQSSEAAFAGLSEDVVLASYTRGLQNGLDVGLEVRDAQDYSVADGGAGNDSLQILFRMSASF